MGTRTVASQKRAASTMTSVQRILTIAQKMKCVEIQKEVIAACVKEDIVGLESCVKT